MGRVVVDVITRPTAAVSLWLQYEARDLSPDLNPCRFMAPRRSASAAALCVSALNIAYTSGIGDKSFSQNFSLRISKFLEWV